MTSLKALAQTSADAIQLGLADLERVHGGRLGVCALDVATGRRIERRANERFAMTSTYKFLAAAFVLRRVDRGEDALDRRIRLFKRPALSRLFSDHGKARHERRMKRSANYARRR